jgi:hypothetical protein
MLNEVDDAGHSFVLEDGFFDGCGHEIAFGDREGNVWFELYPTTKD